MNVRSPRLAVAGLLVAGTLLVAACSDDPNDAATTTAAPAETTAAPTTTLGEYVPPMGDIVGQATTAGAFATLAGFLVDAGLVHALQEPAGPFTVFAPTDAAFAAVPADTVDAVASDKDLLTAVLTYHVVPGEYKVEDLTDGQELETLQGEKLTITKDGDTTFVNGIEIVTPDVEATNGWIHVINSGVLVPPSVAG